MYSNTNVDIDSRFGLREHNPWFLVFLNVQNPGNDTLANIWAEYPNNVRLDKSSPFVRPALTPTPYLKGTHIVLH